MREKLEEAKEKISKIQQNNSLPINTINCENLENRQNQLNEVNQEDLMIQKEKSKREIPLQNDENDSIAKKYLMQRKYKEELDKMIQVKKAKRQEEEGNLDREFDKNENMKYADERKDRLESNFKTEIDPKGINEEILNKKIIERSQDPHVDKIQMYQQKLEGKDIFLTGDLNRRMQRRKFEEAQKRQDQIYLNHLKRIYPDAAKSLSSNEVANFSMNCKNQLTGKMIKDIKERADKIREKEIAVYNEEQNRMEEKRMIEEKLRIRDMYKNDLSFQLKSRDFQKRPGIPEDSVQYQKRPDDNYKVDEANFQGENLQIQNYNNVNVGNMGNQGNPGNAGNIGNYGNAGNFGNDPKQGQRKGVLREAALNSLQIN